MTTLQPHRLKSKRRYRRTVLCTCGSGVLTYYDLRLPPPVWLRSYLSLF